MRSLYPDSVYFDFLEGIRGRCEGHPRLAALLLAVEFPTLRTDEARAVCCDWRAGNVRESRKNA